MDVSTRCTDCNRNLPEDGNGKRQWHNPRGSRFVNESGGANSALNCPYPPKDKAQSALNNRGCGVVHWDTAHFVSLVSAARVSAMQLGSCLLQCSSQLCLPSFCPAQPATLIWKTFTATVLSTCRQRCFGCYPPIRKKGDSPWSDDIDPLQWGGGCHLSFIVMRPLGTHYLPI